jgi:hypothetical protein
MLWQYLTIWRTAQDRKTLSLFRGFITHGFDQVRSKKI